MGGGNPADLVLMGGHAYLVDAARSWAGAVAVSDGLLAFTHVVPSPAVTVFPHSVAARTGGCEPGG